MHRVLVLHGPNLNLLGKREPGIYGSQTLDEINRQLVSHGQDLSLEVVCKQSNHEGQMIDILHDCREWADAIVLNAGGYTHTSVALRDGVAAIALPVVEVHLSNIYAREEFRSKSLLAPVCKGSISGFGMDSYLLALQALAWMLADPVDGS